MKTRYSWIIVIIMLAVFWPVGLFMLIRNILSSAPNNKSVSGKSVIGSIMMGIGCFFAFFTFTFLMSVIDNGFELDDIWTLIFLLTITGVFVSIGITLKRRQKTFAKYIRVLNAYRRIPLEKVAPMIPAQYQQAVEDIERLVSADMIPGLFIDYSTKEVVNPSAEDDYYSSVEYFSMQKVIIECKNCLATNEVPRNNPGRCPYCGSPLV